ncbi:MAG: protein-export chaperone SecB [Gammaproteobacteria bacterium]|nr:protein-export chaperone SecB [Gammaproteobacteria bacterium]
MTEEVKSDDNNAPEFAIQTLYVKDLSYEAPNVPQVFQEDWQPEVNLDLDVKSNELEEGVYESILKVTATVKLPKNTAFLVEVEQAGIFTVKNFEKDQLHAMLGSFCPSVLFPYAREVVSDMVIKGGFPPLYLAPVNFDALYQQQMEAEKEGGDTGEGRIIH